MNLQEFNFSLSQTRYKSPTRCFVFRYPSSSNLKRFRNAFDCNSGDMQFLKEILKALIVWYIQLVTSFDIEFLDRS